MSKKVLAIYYTQSGQLEDIIDNFTAPFVQQGMTVEKIRIRTQKEFAFPWTSKRFFDAMPESVLGVPAPLEDFQPKESTYDLIVVGYQPWYLSPSIPATALLTHPAFKAVAKNIPVITIIGARNMWLNAQEKVKKLLRDAGARLSGNIALVDKHNNLVSVVTILYWMMTGKRDKYLGIFPKPGVSDEDIAQTKAFGELVIPHLQGNTWEGLQTKLIQAKALEVKSDLMFIEQRAGRLFSIWGNLIIKKKNRTAWLTVFKYYLLIALFIVAPIVLIINTIFFKPFLLKRIRRKKQYYLELN